MIDERELRYAVNRWIEADVITGEQGQRILASELLEKSTQLPPSLTPTHQSLEQLFAAVRAFVKRHPGASVVSSDDPRARQLGWSAMKTEGEVEHYQRFSIALTSLKECMTGLAVDDPLRANLACAEGRARIAAQLMQAPA